MTKRKKDGLPELQDRVKHKTSAFPVVGTVIAKYSSHHMLNGAPLLDVRRDDDSKIEYATPAKNWETLSTEEERI